MVAVALSGLHSRTARFISADDLLISSPGSVARAPSLVGPRLLSYVLLRSMLSLYLTAVATNVSAGVIRCNERLVVRVLVLERGGEGTG